MEITVDVFRTNLLLLPIKTFIKQIAYSPTSLGEQVALSSLVVFDEELQAQLKQASLTDSISHNERIRFFTKDKLISDLSRIAYEIGKAFDFIKITICGYKFLDEKSKCFFELLDLNKNISIQWEYESRKDYRELSLYLEKKEYIVEQMLKLRRDFSKEEYLFLHDVALRYIAAADPWNASFILKKLLVQRESASVLISLGRCCVMEEKNVEGENYFRRALQIGDRGEKVNIYYALSMLYIKHYEKDARDIEKAECFINSAYAILQSATPEEFSELTFNKVFNRNGFALVLFKQARIFGAIRILKWGINLLGSIAHSDHVFMHQSVLMYNLALCYSKLNDETQIRRCYKRLFEIDPLYVEYRIKYILELLRFNKSDEAKEELDCILALDSNNYHALSLNLKLNGDSMTEIEKLQTNKKIYFLTYPNFSAAYNFSSLLLEVGDYKECKIVLDRVNVNELNSDEYEDFISLYAEYWLNIGNSNNALNTLELGIEALGTSKIINENILYVKTNLITTNY